MTGQLVLLADDCAQLNTGIWLLRRAPLDRQLEALPDVAREVRQLRVGMDSLVSDVGVARLYIDAALIGRPPRNSAANGHR